VIILPECVVSVLIRFLGFACATDYSCAYIAVPSLRFLEVEHKHGSCIWVVPHSARKRPEREANSLIESVT
jgi:hypothetical protein